MSGGRTHIPQVDNSQCAVCGVCTWECPAAVFTELGKETDSLRGAVFSARHYPGKTPQYPPCRLACPLEQDVPEYIRSIAAEQFDKAAEIILQTNALPSVCGRVCNAACARACVQNSLEKGVDIRGLKRFAIEAAKHYEPNSTPTKNLLKVAIIGGGPAGLAAAHRMVQLGSKPVIFEAEKIAGGLLVSAHDCFVLPDQMVAKDVARLIEMGVEIRCNTRVGVDIKWSDLEQQFDAVLVTCGAGFKKTPAIKGNDLTGVTNSVSFGIAVRRGKKTSGSVVVQGGGKAAIMNARSAKRNGAMQVTLVHHAPLNLWPAGSELIEITQREGIEFIPAARVAGLHGGEKLDAVAVNEFELGNSDDVGRPELLGISKKGTLKADIFVAATDRRVAVESKPDFKEMTLGPLGSLFVDTDYRLPRKKWYAAGEAATGAASVVDSMATGRLAANAIIRDIQGGGR